MKRPLLTVLGFLILLAGIGWYVLGTRGAEQARGVAAEIEVTIALPESPFNRDIDIPVRGDLHFAVVITNRTDKVIQFVQENNSWGDGALHFEADDNRGNHYVIRKKPAIWLDNGLTYWLLKPGEPLVLEICFGAKRQGDDMWTGLPDLKRNGDNLKVTMKAVFDLKSGEIGETKVWTGHAESKAIQCVLRDLR